MLENTPLYKLYLDSRKNGGNRKLSYYVNHDTDLLEQLTLETNFLPCDSSISERLYCYIHNISSTPKCPYCGNKLKYYGKLNKGYCSTCGNDKCKQTGIVKGAKNRSQEERKLAAAKGRLTYFKRTGYYSNMQNPEDLAKWQRVFEEKYGVKTPLENKEFLDKAKSTTIKHFGTLDILHTDKSINTIIERYGSIDNMNKEVAIKRGIKLSNLRKKEIEDKISSYNFSIINYDKDIFTLKCDKCNHIFSITRQGVNYYSHNNVRWCPKCDYKNMTFRSNIEKEIGKDILNFYNGEIQYNKHIGKYEVDLFFPDKNLAIEINGLYWHCDIYRNKTYHIDKKKYIELQGINLVYIWEDEINDKVKYKIVLSRIQNKLGISNKIYARKCVIKKYTSKDVKMILRPFLNSNHLQGYCAGFAYYGLEYNKELVELIVIGKKRKLIGSSKYDYELIRLCTKCGYSIIGGFSKLIKHALNDLHIDNIFSFADLSWSKLNNCSYNIIGFKNVKITEPSYWWASNGLRYNRLNFTKSKLVKLGYDKNKSEDDIMRNDRKYLKIWGPGNLLLEYKK